MPPRPATTGPSWPWLALLGVLWGITFPMTRLGVAAGADPFPLVTLDFAIAAAATAPFALAARTRPSSLRRAAESAALGALLIGGINIPLYWGVQFATGGAASIVYATSPLVSLAALAGLGAGSRLGARHAAALGLGLAGVVVVALAAGGAVVTDPLGLVAFGLGATCQGVGAVLMGRRRPAGEDAGGRTAQFAGGLAVSALVVLVAGGSRALPLSAPVLGSALYVGVASMAVGYAVFYELLRRDGAVYANQVTFLNPVVALAFGALAFGEAFRPTELAGLALILVALLLLQLPRPAAARPAPAPRRELLAPEPVEPG